jgi:acyl-CoA thioesterase-1
VTDRRVLFFGDDIIAGARDPTGLGVVGRLVVAAHTAGVPVTAFNLGVLGDTSVGVSRRWRKEASPRTAPDEPWSPVFCVGSNDTAPVRASVRVDELASVQALQKMLARTREAGLAPLVIGPPPIGDPPQRRRTVSLSDRFDAICRLYDTPYLETAAPLSSSPAWITDLHRGAGRPRVAGYTALVDLIVSHWLEWLGLGVRCPTPVVHG